jgi:predicted ATP-dependent endonuclease of OLD family
MEISIDLTKMHFSQLHFQNFRSITRLKFKKLHRLNCFIGSHNSGKTNILDGISVFWDPYLRAKVQKNQLKVSLGQQVKKSPPILSFLGNSDIIRGFFELELDQNVKVWRENNFLNEIFINVAKIHNHKQTHDFLNIFLDNLETVASPMSVVAFRFDMALSNDLTSVNQKCYLRLRNDEIVPFSTPDLKIIIQAIGSAFIRRVHEVSFEQELLHNRFIDFIKNKDYDAISAIESFIKDIVDQEFVFELGNIIGQTQEIEVTIEQAFTSPLWRISKSTIRLIILASILTFNPINQIVIIDEPNLHLHPKGERKIARILEKISNTHQIFFSTHSTRVLIGHAYLVELVKGFTKMKPIRGERSMRKVVKLLGIRPSDSFGSDTVVFVEGLTDARVFRVFEDLIREIDFSKVFLFRVSYIGVGGWTNVKFVLSLELLRSKFVRSRAIAITDGDITGTETYFSLKKNWESVFPKSSFFTLHEQSIESLFLNNPLVFLRVKFKPQNKLPSLGELEDYIKKERMKGLSSDKTITRKIIENLFGLRYKSLIAEKLAKSFKKSEIPKYIVDFFNEFIIQN